jgi:hypothetical protein
LLSVQREAEVVAEPAPYRLVGVELDGETRRLRARLAPQPPNGSRVSLLIDEESLPTKQVDGDASSWDAPPPEKWSSARGLFARARVETAGGAFETAARWIDDPAALRAAAQDRRVAVTLSRLLSAADANECRRIADDLQFAMDAIFSDRSAFADPPPARKSSTAPTAEEWREAPRLDPARLAVALGAPHSHASSHFLGQAGGALATGGVFDAMCPPDEDDVGPEDDATAGEEGESSSAPREPLDPTPAASRPAPPERLRLRVAKHMESYLTRLSASAFVSTCTATQLVNAVAFPIALAALGTRSGWADAANAQRWTVTAVTVLLHAPVEGAPDGGILRAVSDRYRADGRSDVFGRAVGNGLLWAATATVLASSEWSGAGGRIRRALLLRDIFRRDELTSSVDLEQLRVAARRFRGGDAVATMRDELPRVDASLEALEAWLAAGFEVAVKKQTASNCATEPGDPLWRPKAGWVFAAIGKSQTPDGKPLVDPWHPGQFIGRKSPIPISRGFYVNVRALLEDPAAAPLLP